MESFAFYVVPHVSCSASLGYTNHP
jgi:hypothetical protein